jgi:tetratricopeptide (TPR) repeat protein
MKKFINLTILMLFFAMPCVAATKPPIGWDIPSSDYSNPPVEEKKPEEEQTVEVVAPSQYNDIREQARFAYNANEQEESLKLFAKIPDSEKTSDDWMLLANISQDSEKLIDTVFYLNKAIQTDDKNYKAHYNLGNIYLSDDKVNMAIDEYKKAIKLKKDFSYAYYNLGCCYIKKKNYFNAKYEFGLAIKANPDEPSFYYNLAYVYKMQKKEKKAKEALDIYNDLMSR